MKPETTPRWPFLPQTNLSWLQDALDEAHRNIIAVTGIDKLPSERPQTFLAEWRAKHYGIR